MKTKNITISVPTELATQLHAAVGRRELSKFATKALEKALADKMHALKKAYAAANNDPDRIKTIQEWESLEVEDWE